MDLKDAEQLQHTGEYRLLMLQPDPDNGERICVGVLVGGELLYDARLTRARCLSRELKPDLVRFYLSDFKHRVPHLSGESLERVAKEYAPTFVLSAPRRVATPVEEPIKLMLLRRFVGGFDAEFSLTGESKPKPADLRQQFAVKLTRLASEIVDRTASEMIENAKPKDIFGEKHPRVGVIPLAIRKPGRTLLMDGVDLNVLEPKEAITATGRVVHTFWQYKLAAEHYGTQLTRIAVVFNGIKARGDAFRDAHDFAIHQFGKEAETTVEASSQEGLNQLAGLLK